jgi:large subunit ribosomal protein L18
MEKNKVTRKRRLRRKRGIRKRVFGTPDQPRLSIFRSQKHIYAQAIDDVRGRTLAAASTVKADAGCTVEQAKVVGASIADKLKRDGIERVSFDRNGFRYHGRVKAVADAAREAGLNF